MRFFKKLGALGLLLFSASIFAEDYHSFKDFLQQSQLNGDLRAYQFTRNTSLPVTAQNSFSLGGGLNFLSAPLDGFKGGLSYYAADSLGLNSGIFSHTDQTLPGRSINVLGQSFLQYQNPLWMIKAGNEIIKTPWLSNADTRMIPATYQGVYATFKPIENLKLSVLRTLEYKSRTSKEFNHTNLYSPGNYGDTAIAEMQNIAVKGAFATGINYQWLQASQDMQTQGWFYQFYDFGKLIYLDNIYHFKNASPLDPFINLQAGEEWGDGKNYLQSFGLGATRSLFYGAEVGFDASEDKLRLGYNRIPINNGAYKNGDIVSPYTTGYVFDPLYTSSMIAGLVEKSSGQAYKLENSAFLFDKKLIISLSAAKYFTSATTPNTTEMDMGIKYVFTHGKWKGLHLTSLVGVSNGNPATGRFLYNRIMIDYVFS